MAEPFDDPRLRDLDPKATGRGRPYVRFESVADVIYLVFETDDGPALISLNHREALALAIDLIYVSKAVAVLEERSPRKMRTSPLWDPMSVQDRGTTPL